MADTKISDESAAGTLTGAELVLVVQSGANKRTTTGAIAGLVGDWPVTTVTGASATLSAESQIVICTYSGAVTLTLPAPAAGLRYIVKTPAGDATVTLRPHDTSGAGPTIEDGAAGADSALAANPGNAWSVLSSATAWFRSDYITPASTSAATWTITEAGAAPSSVADEVQVFALQVGGRTEPQVRCSDGEIMELTRTTIRAVTASTFTFAAHDETVMCSTGSNAITGTLPTPSNHAGRMYLVWKKNTGTNKITLARAASEKINDVAASYDLPDSATAAMGSWHIVCDGTDWWVSGGAL